MKYVARIAEAFDHLLTYIVFALIVLTARCAPAKLNVGQPVSPDSAATRTTAAPPDSFPSINHVNVEPDMDAHFVMLRSRMAGHTTLPDAETLECLYGVVRSDTAFVLLTGHTAIQEAGPMVVWFQPCARLKPSALGPLRYLGTWHPHNGGVDCAFSELDSRGFYEDRETLLELVTCSKGTIARSKR